jgi:outer membrane receptor protein involved in Fe transport
LTYPYNSSKPTRVWGLEIEHQANLRFLPGLLSNIVLSYNFSLIRSETYVASSVLQKYFVTLPGIPFPVEKSRAVLVETKQRLEGQPEFFGNLAFGYDIGGFSGRISIFYQGDFYRTFSGDGRTDQLTDKYTKWDLALKQQLTDNISVLFNLNNFTDMSEGTSIKNQITGWRLLDTMQRYGLNADLGLRVNL